MPPHEKSVLVSKSSNRASRFIFQRDTESDTLLSPRAPALTPPPACSCASSHSTQTYVTDQTFGDLGTR